VTSTFHSALACSLATCVTAFKLQSNGFIVSVRLFPRIQALNTTCHGPRHGDRPSDPSLGSHTYPHPHLVTPLHSTAHCTQPALHGAAPLKSTTSPARKPPNEPRKCRRRPSPSSSSSPPPSPPR
uniref:Uncharacterized protein n=1 Tax=Aegilops tauschii subsp. strangulata TaxID=200361 RepID=A0A453D815_AEGTS